MARTTLLSPLRSFYTLLTGASSKRWPGMSRFAPWLLALTLALSIAQFSVFLATGEQLRRLGGGIVCQTAGSWMPAESRVMALPVVFASLDGGERFSIGGAVSGIFIHWATLIQPLILTVLLSAFLTCHFRRAGLSNRAGMVAAVSLLNLLAAVGLQAYRLAVDESRVEFHLNWCWMTDADMAGVRRERGVRRDLMAAVWWIGALAMMCLTLYIALATIAAAENRKDERRQYVRPQGLRASANAAQRGTTAARPTAAPTEPTIAPAPIPSIIVTAPTMPAAIARPVDLRTAGGRILASVNGDGRREAQNPSAEPTNPRTVG